MGFGYHGVLQGLGGYRGVEVLAVQTGDTTPNNHEVIVSFVRNGGSVQPFEFSDSTSAPPATSTIRFNHATFANITEIYVSDSSVSNFDVSAWLDSIERDDVRVTIYRYDDQDVLRIFKVTDVAVMSGYHKLTVVPIHSAGTIADGARIALASSNTSPIRDRAGALVKQESFSHGWPSGHSVFSNCTFLESDVAVLLDEPGANANNCADNVFLQVSFLNCGVGVKATTIQVVNNTFLNCDFNECVTGIDHELGGDVRVFGGSMNGPGTGGVFMKVRGGGENCSSFVMSGVRVEMRAGKPSLIETTEAEQVNVSIDGFSWSGVGVPAAYNSGTTYGENAEVRVGTTYYLSKFNGNSNKYPPTSPEWWTWIGEPIRPVRLGAQTNCTIRGSIVKGPFASVTGGASKATLILNNCRMYYNEADVITSDSAGYWKLVDCTLDDGTPRANTGNWPLDPQYVITAGKAGGQTVYGGTESSENLTLVSTFNNTKGAIILGANIFRVGPGDVARLAQYPLQFASSTGASDDVGIKRSAAGILQVTNASSGLGSLLLGSSTTTNASLTIRAIGSQSANLTQWQNSSSTTLLSISAAGQVVTPVGADATSGTAGAGTNMTIAPGNGGNGVYSGGVLDANGGAGGTLSINAGTGGNGYSDNLGADGGTGGSIKLQPGAGGAGAGSGTDGAAGEVVVNDSGLATNFRVESDSDASCLLVDGLNNAVKLGSTASTRVIQAAPNSAPSDGLIGSSQISFWLDQSGNNLKARVRYSDGTYKTATLGLT